jgi:hypothetical protein
MASITASIDVAAPVDRVWERITDWPAHGRWTPLTTVTVTSDQPAGVGASFVGRSGLGPIGFDDPMEIVEWVPPVDGRAGYCRVRKHGRVVLGWADFEVRGGPGGASTVRWTEEVRIAPVRLTRPVDRLIAVVGRFGLYRVLRAMAAEVEKEGESGG